MAKYAEKHWKNYNSSYRKFNDVGGDCTKARPPLVAASHRAAPRRALRGTAHRVRWRGRR
ncbi:amidase domain-containing protein [Streptomyces sp. AS02]|uniref:amidase domain-containing protein n=1 Tax=Streptomyces sp. AS02 TaxID=2938946 RepID=UPI0034D68467